MRDLQARVTAGNRAFHVEGYELIEYDLRYVDVFARLPVYGCRESSPAQVNYHSVGKPEIRRWVETFVKTLNLTRHRPEKPDRPRRGVPAIPSQLR